MNRYLRIYLLTLTFCIGFPYSAFIICSNISNSWTYEVDSHINSIDISSNDEYIIAGTYGGYVYLFHKNNPNPIQIYNINEEVFKVDICADGKYIVVGIREKLLLFSQTSSNIVREYNVSYNTGSIFSFSDNGEFIVAGSSYYSWSPSSVDKLFFFSRDNSIPIWELPISVTKTSITSNGDYFIIGGSYGLSLFSRLGSNPIWTLGCSPASISISNSGDYIIIGDDFDASLYIFRRESATPIWNYHFYNYPNPVILSPDGNYIITVSNKLLYLFKKESSTPLWTYKVIGQNTYAKDGDVSFSAEFFTITMDLSPWEESKSIVYIFKKYQATPIWSKNFNGYENILKLGHEADFIVVGVNADFHKMIYKIDFLSIFPRMDYIEGFLYILFFLGIPCTAFISISFLLDFIVIKRRYAKQIVHAEEKLGKRFYDDLSKQFERWEKKKDKKYENND